MNSGVYVSVAVDSFDISVTFKASDLILVVIPALISTAECHSERHRIKRNVEIIIWID